MRNSTPVHVFVFDSDYFAMKWAASQVAKDPRTILCGEAGRPEALAAFDVHQPVDVMLLGGFSPDHEGEIVHFVNTLRDQNPHVMLLWLVNEIPEKPIRPAAGRERGNLQGLDGMPFNGALLKREVGLGLVAAIMKARPDRLIYTPGCEAIAFDLPGRVGKEMVRLPAWAPNPNLTHRQMALILLRVMYGLRASSAAGELSVQPQTVEKYMTRIYDTVQNNHLVDDSDLSLAASSLLSPEETAFLWFTALPRF